MQRPASIMIRPLALSLIVAPSLLAVGCAVSVKTPPAGESPEREIVPPETAAEGALAATIRGRFLLPDGEPAAGVSLNVNGWGANQERKLKYGMPTDWVDPQGVSKPDGTFALVFDPPRAFQFTLDARLEGHAEVSWRWSEILPGETVDVKDVVLARGGAIEGRIVDGDGNPLPGAGWRVYASKDDRSSGGRAPTRRSVAAHSDTGSFRIESMPPGPVELTAHHEMANWIDGPSITVVGGETVEATIVYDGVSFANRITVSTSSRPFYVMGNPDPSSIKLYGRDPEPRLAVKLPGSSRSYTFDDLASGLYTVEVDDPRYRPWRKDGVRPGAKVRARLEGNAALHMNVLDRETGEPVELYALRVRFRGVNFHPDEFEVHDGSEPLPGRRFEGMFPGNYTLTIRAEGYGLAAVDVDELLAGETRSVTVLLGSPTVVSGRITTDGRAVAGVDVLLLRPAEVDDSSASPVLRSDSFTGDESRHRKEIEAASTDADGRFELRIAAAGTYVLFAERGGGIQVSSEPFALAMGEKKRMDLALPAAGKLIGRVLSPGGSSPNGLRVWVRSETPAGPAHAMFRSLQRDSVVLGDDGIFESGPLAPGEATVFLFLPAKFQSGFSTLGERPGGALELGKVAIPDGAVVERDFSLAGEFPGTIRVTVRNHGVPLSGARLTLVATEGGGRLVAETNAHGQAVPIPAFPGLWDIHVSVPRADLPRGDWSYRHPEPATVVSGVEVRLDVDVEATEATLVFVDAETSEPLGARKIGYERFDPDRPSQPIFRNPRTTDAEGRVTLTLTPGEYRFVLDPVDLFEAAKKEGEEKQEPREVRVIWTSHGPERDELRL